MNRLLATGFLAAAAILSTDLAPSHASALDTITIADIGAGSAIHWPAYGAMAKGFFQKNGLNVEYIPTDSGASAMLQLASGSADMAATGSVDPLRAIDKGAPLTMLRIEAGPAPYQVYAKPNIHSFADLKGKKVILDGIKGITRLYFDRMGAAKGLAPGSYDMVFSGSTSARFAALVSGSVDAAILNTPFNFKARAAHFSYLATPPDYSKGIPFNVYSVNTAWAKTHKPLIAKFLSAFAEGVDWFYNPAHRQEAVDILMKKSSVSQADAEEAYDYYVSLKEFDRTGAVTQDSVGTLLDVMKAQGDIAGSADISRFYNADLVGAAQ